MANDGSTPQAWTATVSIEVVDVLPWVPATATLRRPAITAASATARGSTRSPRSRAAASSGLSARMAVETTTVSASPRWAGSWPTSTRAPSARSASRVGVSRRSLPETADAAGQQDPRDAAHAGAADADEVHRAQLGERRHRLGPGGDVRRRSSARRHLQHHRRQPLVGVGHPGGGGVRGVPAERGRVGEQRHQRASRSRRGSGRRPRPAALPRPRRPAARCAAARRCRSAAGRTRPAARRPTARRRSPRRSGRARGRRRRRRGPCAPDSPRRRRAHCPPGGREP